MAYASHELEIAYLTSLALIITLFISINFSWDMRKFCSDPLWLGCLALVLLCAAMFCMVLTAFGAVSLLYNSSLLTPLRRLGDKTMYRLFCCSLILIFLQAVLRIFIELKFSSKCPSDKTIFGVIVVFCFMIPFFIVMRPYSQYLKELVKKAASKEQNA